MSSAGNIDLKDKAGEAYWSSFWLDHSLPAPVEVEKRTEQNYAFRKLDAFLSVIFAQEKTKGKKLIEVGCGNSVYLSYFSKRFGFQPEGLDYSEFGCEQTRRILQRDQVTGIIHHGDLFHPTPELLARFDVVCSFGVVEHFQNTVEVIGKIAAFLKPGGIMITTIPNLTGPTGWLQRWMNRPVYDIHKVMGLRDLKKASELAGLEIISSRHFVPVSFGVTLTEKDGVKISNLRIKRMLLKCFQLAGRVICRIDDRLIRVPETEWLCAGMIVAARKPISS